MAGAAVERLVRHRGRVWAEGAIDGGATFYFTLGGTASCGAAAESPPALPKQITERA